MRMQLRRCDRKGLARALHALQDYYSQAHQNFTKYKGTLADRIKIPMLSSILKGIPLVPLSHLLHDSFPSMDEYKGVPIVTENLIRQFQEMCSCSLN